MLAGVFKRQRTGSVVCASCRIARRRERRDVLHCGRRNPGIWGFGPMLRAFGNDLGFVTLVVYGCSASTSSAFCARVALRRQHPRQRQPAGARCRRTRHPVHARRHRRATGLPFGRWWTILSAAWLHGGVLHILFNMLWVRQLGPATADIYGPGPHGDHLFRRRRSGLHGQQPRRLFHRLDADPFPPRRGHDRRCISRYLGLLGALVYYGRRGGSSLIRTEALGYAVTLGVMGLILPGVDNYAHGGGFLGGYLAGMFSTHSSQSAWITS